MRHQLANLKNKRMLTAGIICLLLIVFMIAYRATNRQQGGPPQADPVQIEVMTLARGDLSKHISLTGQTVSDASISLAPKYAGKITAVNVDLGDRVTEGQILLVQDTGDLDIAIVQGRAEAEAAGADAITTQAGYEADFLRTEAAYEIQRQHYERQQYLLSIGAISQDTLDSARDEYVTAKAAYDALANQSAGGGTPASVRSKEMAALKSRYAVAALEKQRSDMFLRAPRDGVISYRHAEVGDYASAGSTLLTLVDNSHVFVDCHLSESDAAVLEPGMQVKVTIDAMGRDYVGKIVFVSPAMGDTSKTFTARISLDADKAEIKAGLFARTAVDILQRSNTLFVPKEAVLSKNGESLVYVYDKDSKTVAARRVKLGLINDTESEIIDGLAEGDLVVISGQDRVQDGMTVQLKGA